MSFRPEATPAGTLAKAVEAAQRHFGVDPMLDPRERGATSIEKIMVMYLTELDLALPNVGKGVNTETASPTGRAGPRPGASSGRFASSGAGGDSGITFDASSAGGGGRSQSPAGARATGGLGEASVAGQRGSPGGFDFGDTGGGGRGGYEGGSTPTRELEVPFSAEAKKMQMAPVLLFLQRSLCFLQASGGLSSFPPKIPAPPPPQSASTLLLSLFFKGVSLLPARCCVRYQVDALRRRCYELEHAANALPATLEKLRELQAYTKDLATQYELQVSSSSSGGGGASVRCGCECAIRWCCAAAGARCRGSCGECPSGPGPRRRAG